ncbi:hypothetical protein ACFU51_22025 [Streptomyces sp. NPDC057430]|uniref:hypothetical protein n=1 Tax=Streptomyces sp. NPDC057430 TaxID=3346131 RepID=UPI0036830EC8
MIRPAVRRRPQPRPRRAVVRAVFAAAVVSVLAACSTAADTSDPATPSAPPAKAPVASARVTHALPDDPVRMLLPATGAEGRWTQGLDTFGQQVAHTVTASCASKGGFALPQNAPPPAFIRFFELPDLDFIAQHGFSHSAEVPMPAAPPATDRSGTPDEVRRCQDEGAAAADALRKTYVQPQADWFKELDSLSSDPATVKAMAALPDCLARHGIDVPDEDGFFRHTDTRLHSAAPVDLPRENHVLGGAYADCMRPVEAVREPIRERLRTRFLADHTDEIDELRKTLVPALRRAEERHGVRLSFPAP